MATNKFNVLKDKSKLVDQTVSTGSGDYTPPAEGTARGRLVAYVEIGKHETVSKKFGPKKNAKVHLTFELSGSKWEPKVLEDGTKIPQRITIKENLSTSTKAWYYRLFLKMRDDRAEITHMAEMLGEPFLLTIKHREYESTEGGKTVKRIAADVRTQEAWNIKPPYIEVPVYEVDDDGNKVLDDDDQPIPTGETTRKPVKVDEPISDLRLFIWDLADKEQWDSLYIEPGDGDKSRNVFQELIVKALNYTGSQAEAASLGSESLAAILKGGKGSAESAGADDGDDDGGDVVEDAASKKAAAVTKKTKKPPVKVDAANADNLDDID